MTMELTDIASHNSGKMCCILFPIAHGQWDKSAIALLPLSLGPTKLLSCINPAICT